jgi:hypothetical protein
MRVRLIAVGSGAGLFTVERRAMIAVIVIRKAFAVDADVSSCEAASKSYLWLDNDVIDKSHVNSGRAVAGESSGEESLFLPRHHRDPHSANYAPPNLGWLRPIVPSLDLMLVLTSATASTL